MRAESASRLFPKEWFGGNDAAWAAAVTLARLSQVWDDLIDRDEPLSEYQINDAFLTCLVYLPANPFYRSIQDAIAPMWLPVVSAYETANKIEREKDATCMELAHILRFSAGNIIAYMIHVCLGAEGARLVVPELWKFIVNEKFDDYRKEHEHAQEQT